MPSSTETRLAHVEAKIDSLMTAINKLDTTMETLTTKVSEIPLVEERFKQNRGSVEECFRLIRKQETDFMKFKEEQQKVNDRYNRYLYTLIGAGGLVSLVWAAIGVYVVRAVPRLIQLLSEAPAH